MIQFVWCNIVDFFVSLFCEGEPFKTSLNKLNKEKNWLPRDCGNFFCDKTRDLKKRADADLVSNQFGLFIHCCLCVAWHRRGPPDYSRLPAWEKKCHNFRSLLTLITFEMWHFFTVEKKNRVCLFSFSDIKTGFPFLNQPNWWKTVWFCVQKDRFPI